MDTLRAVRLALYFVVGLVLGGVSAMVFAEDYPVMIRYTAGAGLFDTPESACQAWSATYVSAGTYTGIQVNTTLWDGRPNTGFCMASLWGAATSFGVDKSCPYGGLITQTAGVWRCTGAPSCPVGQTRDVDTGQCVNPCQNTAPLGGDDTMMQTDPGSGVSGAVCINGCTHSYSASACVGSGSSLVCGVYGPFTPTGQSCDTSTPTAGDPPAPCKFPYAPGTVNGINVCVPAGKTTKQTTTTATKTDPNGDPSTTTQQQNTTCDGDKCTTTTTTTNTGGGVGGGVIGGSGSGDPASGQNGTTTTQVEQSKTDYCAANPGSATCQKSGSFGGDCSAGFACQGDAVECASAKASWEIACSYRKSDGQSLAEKIGAGNDPNAANMPWHDSQKKTNDVSGLLNQANPYGAACMSDIQFSIAGRSGTIPTSEWCTILTWIGNLMLAGALMGAAAIIFKR